MVNFIIKSIVERLVLLVFISIISYSIVHLAPGEPSMVDPANPRMKAEDIARIRAAFHLDDPIHVQYFFWVRDLFTGQLKSFKDNQPVLNKIYDRFLNSLPLFFLATVITWMVAFPIGIAAAFGRGSIFDKSTTLISYILISFPNFFISYLVIIYMVQTFNIPVIGMQTFGMEGAPLINRLMDRVWHLTVPALMTALVGIGVLSRYVRSTLLEVLGQDFIRSARAKGIPEEFVRYKHALRNALLPFITMFGLLIPGFIGGSVIFETIFAWPGMGRLGYEAILNRDFPVILTLNFIAAILTLIGTLVSDILYAIVDPRIKLLP